jgi:hypothetical protein
MPSIPTVESLRKLHRKLDRRQRQVDDYIEWMRRRGCALHVYFTFGKPTFVLSDGTRISEPIGYALTNHPSIVVVDPPLITGGLPQTYRFVDEARRTQ